LHVLQILMDLGIRCRRRQHARPHRF
jgi:hypothetical protein